MFAIVISEKGGAERRELFDKQEINVGRVQGNDLMLPKGNVSKRHARLLFRDGRVIVTDLKSTNGTYVNGRKIAQATIVREGDKIYVGDFVLRVEVTGAAASPSPIRPAIVAAPTGLAGGIVAPPPQARLPSPSEDFTARQDAISSLPLQHDESTGRHTQLDPAESSSPSVSRLPSSSSSTDYLRDSSARAQHGPPVASLLPRPSSPHTPATPREERVASARLLALSALADRVAEAIDLAPLSRGAEPDQVLAHRIERVIREKAKALREEGSLPDTVEVDDVIRDAQRELLGLGALEPLLDDEEVSEIRAFCHDSLIAVRAGEVVELDPAFSNEPALGRVIARLCRQASQPLSQGETIVERYMPRGLLVHALLPPTSQYGHALVIKKRRRAETGLDDLVRSGTISRVMAGFLSACVAARANLLLVGPSQGTALLLSALASASHDRGRIVALQAVDELWGIEPAPICIRLPESGEQAARLVRAAARLSPERLVVHPMNGHVAAAVAGAISEGCEGVLSTVTAPSLRLALDRLLPDMMAAKPGVPADAARSWLHGSFELAVEISELRDGRFRVMRMSELLAQGDAPYRDIFNFVIERTAAGGTIEGSFHATGVVPRLAEDLAARGGGFDLGLFKRER